MARLDTTGLDDIISQMQRMGLNSSPVAEEMVNAAVEVIKESWVESAIRHGHVDTGAMIDSIGYGVPVFASNIIYRDVYPQGKDAKGVSNSEKAFILHYGKHNMDGSNWVDDAEMRAGPTAQKRCIEIWDRFLKSEGG